MSIFQSIQEKPQDPIFGLYQEYLADPRGDKINLGIGTYRNEDGTPYVLESVKKVEQQLAQDIQTKEYLPIAGDPEYIDEAEKILFGFNQNKFFSTQTPGGSSALKLAGEVLGRKRVFVSEQTWPNHFLIFSKLGCQVIPHPYYDKETKQLDREALFSFLDKAKDGAVILQNACHNPTGVDLTKQDWDELLSLLQKNRLVPLFDVAYLGMRDDTFESEMYPIHASVKRGLECLVATSFSKSFGVYAERIGLLSIFALENKQALLSNIKVNIRADYSNPPQHGSLIIREILKSNPLKKLWLEELAKMRNQLKKSRELFKSETQLDYVLHQTGMFSLLNLSEQEIHQLKKEFGIYLPLNGRLNFAAINQHNIGRIAHALQKSS